VSGHRGVDQKETLPQQYSRVPSKHMDFSPARRWFCLMLLHGGSYLSSFGVLSISAISDDYPQTPAVSLWWLTDHTCKTEKQPCKPLIVVLKWGMF